VFENVEGFLTAGDGARVLELLEPVIEAGYRVHLRKINAANYGVPQHRKRVLAIGGLGWEPRFPAPTHSAFGAPGAHRAASHLPLTPTLAEALTGLPAPSEKAPGIPPDHVSRALRDLDLVRATAMKPGETMRDLPEELWHESYRRRAFRRVMDGTPSERRGGAPAGLRRLHPDAPSKAITSGARSEFLHPSAHRLLTLRECARIQTFPDTFSFVGTASERALLIGNAVPPRLGRAVAEALSADLATAGDEQAGGALLSFVPTR
jgi:DNA (cytosine-5)-methyltransferase 1